MKRRVATDHPEWDLCVYSGVDSNYSEAEVSTKGVDTLIEVGAGSAEGGDPAKEVGEVGGQNTGKTQATDVFRETVLIVDDEQTA